MMDTISGSLLGLCFAITAGTGLLFVIAEVLDWMEDRRPPKGPP